jgi:hypothetical protein
LNGFTSIVGALAHSASPLFADTVKPEAYAAALEENNSPSGASQ